MIYRLKVLLYQLLLLLMFFMVNVFAQSPLVGESVSVLDAESIMKPGVFNRMELDRSNGVIIRERYARLNRALIDKSNILINLFEDYSPEGDFRKMEVRSLKDISWTGRLAENPLGNINLVLRGENITGDIRDGARYFQIRPVDDGMHWIAEIDPSQLPDVCETEDVAENNFTPETYSKPNRGLKLNIPADEILPTEAVTIDVLVLYTDDAADAASDISAEVQLMIDVTNNALAASGISPRVRLIHSAEVEYAESNSSATDLDRLEDDDDGFMDEAHTLRETYGADLVSLIVESLSGGACGRANLSPTSTGNSNWAFGVVRRSCAVGNLSFPHELGHNLGCRHDWYVDGTNNSPFTYNHGYKVVAEGWRTIMSYNNECSANATSCTRLAYFSNPDTLHPTTSTPMGIAEGNPSAADNRKTWNNMGSVIAAYRSNSASPVINIGNASVREGDAGSVNLDFEVYLSEDPSVQVSVTYYTADSTATSSGDYTSVSSDTVIFAIGDSTETISVAVNGDISNESDEYLKVILTDPTNGVISDSLGVGTIIDDENIGEIAVNPAAFSVSVLADSSLVDSITIENVGDASLTYAMKERAAASKQKTGKTKPAGSRSWRPLPFAKAGDTPRVSDDATDMTIGKPAGLPLETTQFTDSLVYEDYTSGDWYTNVGYGTQTPFYVGVKFTTSGPFTLSHVHTRYRTYNSTSDIYVSIRDDNSGAPGTEIQRDTLSAAEWRHYYSEWELIELSSTVSFGSSEDFWITLEFQDVPWPMNLTDSLVNVDSRASFSSNGSTWYDIHGSYPGDVWIIRALEQFDLSWLSLGGTGGSISSGDSAKVAVTFDANGLNVGAYNGELIVSSNDPFNSDITVPLTFNVLGPLVVNAKAVLEGPYDSTGSSMNTFLGENDLLPLSQPFSGSNWSYSGSESVSTIPSGVVDWVLLRLRSESNAETLTASRAAFLKSDGSIVDTNGVSVVSFPGTTHGDYYICVYHRNHLGVMSANKLTLNSSSALYDFSLSGNAYGSSPTKQIGSSGPYCLRSGDGNSDGGVDALDKNLIWRDENGSVWSYSKKGDLNLDGGIDALDLNLHWRLDNGKASQIPGNASENAAGTQQSAREKNLK